MDNIIEELIFKSGYKFWFKNKTLPISGATPYYYNKYIFQNSEDEKTNIEKYDVNGKVIWRPWHDDIIIQVLDAPKMIYITIIDNKKNEAFKSFDLIKPSTIKNYQIIEKMLNE
jgi:hypothetical protein